MPTYRVDYQFTELGKRKLVEMEPQLRFAVVQGLVAQAGGTLIELYYTPSSSTSEDGFALIEADDLTSVYAAVVKVNSVGYVNAYATEVLPASQHIVAVEAAITFAYPELPADEPARAD